MHAPAITLAFAAVLAPVPAPTEGDGDSPSWPQWDGPSGDGISRETDWVPEGRDLWELPVGLGYSTVAVHGGRLFTMGYDVESGLDLVWCVDAMTGDEVWVHTYPAAIWNEAHEGGTVNSPSVDTFLGGSVVYTLNREGNLYALDAETGDVNWHVSLTEDEALGVTPPRWGFSGSPLVLEDRLILNCGKLVSIDKATGEVQWASQDYGEAYGTPRVFTLEDREMVCILNGDGVGVVALEDGEELYRSSFGASGNGVNPSAPVVVGDAMFVSSPSGANGLYALVEGELLPVWEARNLRTDKASAVLIDGNLYGFDSTILKCVTLDGDEAWGERGLGSGALSATTDRLLIMTGDGELIVAAANPDEFEVLSRTPLFDEGQFWTKPVLAGGIVYCRSSKGMLIARDHRPAKD